MDNESKLTDILHRAKVSSQKHTSNNNNFKRLYFPMITALTLITLIYIYYTHQPMSERQRLILHALAYDAARTTDSAGPSELRAISLKYNHRSYSDLTRAEYEAAAADLLDRLELASR